jgi:hypothetical protein
MDEIETLEGALEHTLIGVREYDEDTRLNYGAT